MGSRIGLNTTFPKYKRLTVADYLSMPDDVGDSELEKQVWRIAKESNIHFDAAQKYIPLSGGFEATIPDFWINAPPTAIFVDGKQHDLREDVKRDDLIKRNQLRGMGIRVAVIGWRGLIENPHYEVSKILWQT